MSQEEAEEKTRKIFEQKGWIYDRDAEAELSLLLEDCNHDWVAVYYKVRDFASEE